MPKAHNPATGTRRMRGLVILGILAFLAFALMFAPARLLAPLAEAIPGASLRGTSGTVWSGAGQLRLGGRERGRISWSFRPVTLLELFPGYAWTLAGEHLDIGGGINLAPGRAALSITGSVDAAAINPWLVNYEILMAGEFQLRGVFVQFSDNRPDAAGGTVDWSGGRLRYVLAGRPRTVALPPLEARIDFADGPTAKVFAAADASTPLLEAELLDSGFVRIGITRRLTKMLDDPWPGEGPDQKIVLAVEEKIL